jgi:hypothetical protein
LIIQGRILLNPDMKNAGFILLFATVLVMLMGILQACSQVDRGAQEGTSYLTPIPWATVYAAQISNPISNKLEAVSAAQRTLGESSLRSSETPRAVFVERLRYADSRKDFIPPEASTVDTYPPDMQVWLIVFAGQWRVEGGPAAPEVTKSPIPLPSPSSTSERCVIVLFPASADVQGGSVSGIYDCEIWK